jgi:hypothetical protein
VHASPHALQLEFVPRPTQALANHVWPAGQQLLPLQLPLAHWMAELQLPLAFLAAQLVVALSQYWLLEEQLWLARPHAPFPVHAEAFSASRLAEHEAVPQLCPEAG